MITYYIIIDQIERMMVSSKWRKGVTVEALKYNFEKVDDFSISRQFSALVNPGLAILEEADIKKVNFDIFVLLLMLLLL